MLYYQSKIHAIIHSKTAAFPLQGLITKTFMGQNESTIL